MFALTPLLLILTIAQVNCVKVFPKFCGKDGNNVPLFCEPNITRQYANLRVSPVFDMSSDTYYSLSGEIEESINRRYSLRQVNGHSATYSEHINIEKQIKDIPPPLPSRFIDVCFNRTTDEYLTMNYMNDMDLRFSTFMMENLGINTNFSYKPPGYCNFAYTDGLNYFAFPLDVGTDDFGDIVTYYKTKPIRYLFGDWFKRFSGFYVASLNDNFVVPGGKHAGEIFDTHKGLIFGTQGYLKLNSDWTNSNNRKLLECSTPVFAQEILNPAGFYNSIIEFKCYDPDTQLTCSEIETNTYHLGANNTQDEYKVASLSCPSYIL